MSKLWRLEKGEPKSKELGQAEPCGTSEPSVHSPGGPGTSPDSEVRRQFPSELCRSKVCERGEIPSPLKLSTVSGV